MPGHTVPVFLLPVSLVDALLPGLKDTELRLLLVLLRQLRVVGKERERVWLTHKELCRRTGRASEALSAAIDHLSQTGLVCVHDDTGHPLTTATARQRGTGRRYFALSEQAFVSSSRGEVEKAKQDAAKAKTIDISYYPIYGFRKADQAPLLPPSGQGNPPTEPSQDERERQESPADEETLGRIAAEKRRIRETLAAITPAPRLERRRSALTTGMLSAIPGAKEGERPVTDYMP